MATDHDRITRLEERVRANERAAKERALALAEALTLARAIRLSPEDEARMRVLEANQNSQTGATSGTARTWAAIGGVVAAVGVIFGIAVLLLTR